jgi:hypothetical protein
VVWWGGGWVGLLSGRVVVGEKNTSVFWCDAVHIRFQVRITPPVSVRAGVRSATGSGCRVVRAPPTHYVVVAVTPSRQIVVMPLRHYIITDRTLASFVLVAHRLFPPFHHEVVRYHYDHAVGD